VGAFAGGWISRQAIARGRSNADARVFGALVSAIGGLAILTVPFCGTPALATAAISVSSFWAVAGSVNLYTIPVDIWGAERAGTAISALVFGYGVLQTGISPAIGWMADRNAYDAVFWILAPLPLIAWWLLRGLDDAGVKSA
jgi:ACS family hexuronate transporter-like MFS transporter